MRSLIALVLIALSSKASAQLVLQDLGTTGPKTPAPIFSDSEAVKGLKAASGIQGQLFRQVIRTLVSQGFKESKFFNGVRLRTWINEQTEKLTVGVSFHKEWITNGESWSQSVPMTIEATCSQVPDSDVPSCKISKLEIHLENPMVKGPIGGIASGGKVVPEFRKSEMNQLGREIADPRLNP